ncbi:hypothetical protein OHB04_02660 [Streptomyces sp. NBC_01775]|uniref:hypothetical protein n=1 Tax=Streptomyces sp. NBC_01775 TaxID=2975939 RepID=UPI002DDBE948|nr:hypothetical protein [Streptomyces sp. NBC_01775]WSB74795.1 hypothetical protein OHB04_02660 [Streptomyces sp. NBC_01775]
MTTPTPIPDAVADFKARQFPPAVRDAVLARADAERNLTLLLDTATREDVLADIAWADKQLATVPQRLGGDR